MFDKLAKFLQGNGAKPQKGKGRPRDPVKYGQEKERAQSSNTKDRLKLAKDTQTQPEILYYLAEHDQDPAVRKALVKNESLPIQATPILAKDSDSDVRLTLAQRLIKLLPDLSPDHHSQLYAFAVQALAALAMDEVLKIRIALSSALKDKAHAPPKVVGQLARDIERVVSEPVLRYCAALTDEDLLDILSNHPAAWVLQAIASRDMVSTPVSTKMIALDDEPAGATLIENPGAALTPALLTTIIEKAKQFPQWQKPLALRKNLPADLAVELAGIVDLSIRRVLLERDDFDELTINEISTVMRRRMLFMDAGDSSMSPEDRLALLLKSGRTLDEEMLGDAIAVRERDMALAMLAKMAKTDRETVAKILAMKAPKPIVALCWKAGISMRVALIVQQELAGLTGKEVLLPRGGTDYPLSKNDLKWQIDFLNL